MPGEDIQSWSTTAIDNGNSDTAINFLEGQPRASVNNSARAMMAAHAKHRNLGNGSIVTSGTANAQAFTSGVGYTTVPTGLRVLLKIGVDLTNTAAVTLDMDGIGAVALKYPDGSELETDELVANSYADLVYNGTNWVLLASIPPDAETAAPPAVVTVIPPVVVTPGASFVDFTTNIDATFDHYMIDFNNVLPTAQAFMQMRYSIDGGATFVTAATYYNAYMIATHPNVGSALGGLTASYVLCSGTISATAPSVLSGTVDLYNPASTNRLKHAIVRSTAWNNTDGGFRLLHNGGLLNTSSAINAIRFMPNTGTFTSGSFKMFGVRST